MTSRIRWAWKCWLGLGLAALACGCSSSDTDRMARVGRKAGEKLLDLAGGRQGKFAASLRSLRGTLSERDLDDRVATRLRWDQYLREADVRVLPTGPGAVRLEGEVASAAIRQRAEDLARSTLGVEGVVNALAVKPTAAGGEKR
jgi:hypothetical protein